MIKNLLFLIYLIFFFINFNSIIRANEQNYRIIKLVDDQVITNYDLDKRLQLFSILNRVNINKDNIEHYAKEMINLMVDEKLQKEQIKKYQINISEKEVDDYIIIAYSNSDRSFENLNNDLIENDININILKESIKIQLGWNELAGRLFYRKSDINDNDIASKIEKNPGMSEDKAKNLLIQSQIELRAKKLLRDLRLEANIENR